MCASSRQTAYGLEQPESFDDKVNDADARAAADAMVSSVMRGAGYIYVNIDDTWEGEYDVQGNIHPNSKFPLVQIRPYIPVFLTQHRDIGELRQVGIIRIRFVQQNEHSFSYSAFAC